MLKSPFLFFDSDKLKIKIAKKRIKLATTRNRIKRLIKENVRLNKIQKIKIVVLEDVSKQKMQSITKYFKK